MKKPKDPKEWLVAAIERGGNRACVGRCEVLYPKTALVREPQWVVQSECRLTLDYDGDDIRVRCPSDVHLEDLGWTEHDLDDYLLFMGGCNQEFMLMFAETTISNPVIHLLHDNPLVRAQALSLFRLIWTVPKAAFLAIYLDKFVKAMSFEIQIALAALMPTPVGYHLGDKCAFFEGTRSEVEAGLTVPEWPGDTTENYTHKAFGVKLNPFPKHGQTITIDSAMEFLRSKYDCKDTLTLLMEPAAHTYLLNRLFSGVTINGNFSKAN